MSIDSLARQLSHLCSWRWSELFASERQNVPAIDVGGTLIKVGLIPRAAELLYIPAVVVPSLASLDHVVSRTLQTMHDICSQSWVAVRARGLSTPGGIGAIDLDGNSGWSQEVEPHKPGTWRSTERERSFDSGRFCRDFAKRRSFGLH